MQNILDDFHSQNQSLQDLKDKLNAYYKEKGDFLI